MFTQVALVFIFISEIIYYDTYKNQDGENTFSQHRMCLWKPFHRLCVKDDGNGSSGGKNETSYIMLIPAVISGPSL